MTEITVIAIVTRTEEVVTEEIVTPIEMKENQSVGEVIGTEIGVEATVKSGMIRDIETGMSQVVVVPLLKAVILLLLDRSRSLRSPKLLRSLSRNWS